MSGIKEYLANKDQEVNKSYVPSSYQMTPAEKEKALFLEGLTTKYSIENSTGCIKHCFRNLDSPVVSQKESDCMTNCTAKALETLTYFQMNLAKH